MRAIFRLRRATLGGAALALALMVTASACGSDDDDCRQTIFDVPTFVACQNLATQFECSLKGIVYRPGNMNRRSACTLENCTPCRAPTPTPTAVPSDG